MSRSKWKGSFFSKNVLKKKGDIKVWSRHSVISQDFLNKKVAIYNGRSFTFLFVKENHLGFKFGDFSLTRKITKKFNQKKQVKNKLKK
jgi:small subunit ribosomal protein S19